MPRTDKDRGVPAWLLRPVPLNAVEDPDAMAELRSLGDELPQQLCSLRFFLEWHETLASFAPLANAAAAMIWPRLDEFIETHPIEVFDLHRVLPTQAANRILRRLSRHPDNAVRRRVRLQVETEGAIHEVAVPYRPDQPWDARGWLLPHNRAGMARSRNHRALPENIPKLTSVRAVMRELGIVTQKQLGWMLLATDEGNGPYTSFEIPKRHRSGEAKSRKICAPKWQLRRVQQRILHKILDHIEPHDAAHGFRQGRSIVTNAAPHQGKALVLKFDLVDFFPNIHYMRVMGLFASLGFPLSSIYFSTKTRSRQVAPLLARLCTYTEDPKEYRSGLLPQGAPTSPAISNLLCRRLDARLQGLAAKFSADYTRYADDLTFSFQTASDDLQVGRFRWWVDQICHQEGFVVNQGKFRAIRPSQRQTVTGIVVNESARVPRETRRRVRAMIHHLKTQGVSEAAKDNPGFASHLLGMVSYMAMVHPADQVHLDTVRELLANNE